MYLRYCKDAETLQEEDFEGYEGNGSVCFGEEDGYMQKQEERGQMRKQPSRDDEPFHSSSSPLGARGPGQTARKGAERRAGFNEGSAWRERHYSLPLEGRSLEASAKRYAPDCQRRDLISLFVVRGPYQDPISKTIPLTLYYSNSLRKSILLTIAATACSSLAGPTTPPVRAVAD